MMNCGLPCYIINHLLSSAIASYKDTCLLLASYKDTWFFLLLKPMMLMLASLKLAISATAVVPSRVGFSAPSPSTSLRWISPCKLEHSLNDSQVAFFVCIRAMVGNVKKLFACIHAMGPKELRTQNTMI